MKKPGIRRDLVVIWRNNMKEIMRIMNFTQADLAEKMDRTRQSFCNMMSNQEFHLTAIQFLCTMQGVNEMIEESDADDGKKRLAMDYWNMINNVYLKNGLH